MVVTEAKNNNHRMAKKEKSRDNGKAVRHFSHRAKWHAENHPAADRKAVRRRLDHAAGRRSARCRSTAFRPAACRSTSPSAARAFPAAASSRSSGPNRAAKRRSPCTSPPRPRRRAASRPSSTPSTPSIPSWAKKLGVDLEMLLVSQPSSGEEAMQITEMLVKIERGRRDRHRLGGRPRAARKSSTAKSATRTSACRPG